MRIGIIGSGAIVGSFADAVSRSNSRNPNLQLKITSLCGRIESKSKITDLCNKLDIKNIYYDIDEMLESGNVDCVYVGLVNNLHYEAALKCIEHHVPVMVEKPFVSNLKQAEELVAAAKSSGTIIFEMAPNRYFANVAKVKELLPKLGNIRIVTLNYSQYSSRYDSFVRGNILPVFDPKMAGGALMDLGIYNLHFMLSVFGCPTEYHYSANMTNGIDTSGILTMTYKGEYNFNAVSIAAKDCSAPLNINIQGDKGYINSTSPCNIFDSFSISLKDGTNETFNLNSAEDRMVYEIEAFMDLLVSGKTDEAFKSMENTLAAMKILDNARVEAGMSIDF